MYFRGWSVLQICWYYELNAIMSEANSGATISRDVGVEEEKRKRKREIEWEP